MKIVSVMGNLQCWGYDMFTLVVHTKICPEVTASLKCGFENARSTSKK